MLRSFFGLLIAFALLAATATQARAELLSALLDGGVLQVGDKTFSNFGYQSTGDFPGAPDVNVVPFTDEFGNFGLKFQGAFLNFAAGGSSTAALSYTVTVNDANKVIDGARMTGNPSVLFGVGSVAVNESFTEDAATLAIFANNPGPDQFVDQTTFAAGYATLHVHKDIGATSSPNGGIPTLSFFTQTFHQRVVPEPATVVLMGVGLAGVVGVGLRRRRNG